MSGLIRPIISHPLKHIINMLNKREYFNYNFLWSKIGRISRYQECKVKLHGCNLLIPDAWSFIHSYKEIFVEKIYAFKGDNPEPKILDIGANVGLSVLFFKYLYPQAEITAFEADPQIFKYLKKNVHDNGYQDVELINKAVWHENTTLNFASGGADEGRINIEDKSSKDIAIEAVDIVDLLKDKKFDFVKIDIEGAEEFVLPRCKTYLSNIKFLFIEYHSTVDKKQRLNEILNILSEAGFRVHIRDVMKNNAPFIDLRTCGGFDLQLNIFAWQDK